MLSGLLSPVQSNSPHLVEALRNCSVDVAFVRPPLGDGEGLTVHPLVQKPMRIVLPSKHAQARERSVSLATLAHETFILFPRAIGPGLHDSIIASYQRTEFSPVLGQEAPQIASIIYLVAAGFGISIVPHSIEQIRADGIVYVPIKGEARPLRQSVPLFAKTIVSQ